MIYDQVKKETIIGVLLCTFSAILSIKLSNILGYNLFKLEKSPISPIIISIIIGIIMSNLVYPKISKFKNGFDYCIKVFLKIGIILLGIRLSLLDLFKFGLKGLIVIIPCIIITIILVQYLGRKFNVSHNLSLLIAVGTSICGATAIVALAPIIRAKKSEITYAIANITIFGLFAMLLYPILANFLFDKDIISVGLFIGSSIHETAQVAGSSLIYSDQYSEPDVVGIATITKLLRNTLMVIVIPFLAQKSISFNNDKTKLKDIFPYFVIGFIFFGCIRSAGDYFFTLNNINFDFWNNFVKKTKMVAEILLIISMAAVGYNTTLKKFKNLGIEPFIIGLLSASTVGLTSIITIYIINYIFI
tara:strand:- start:2396 stop:3475 length:1080 start_codon:yes stop_codon:yes gene_type:complete